MKKIIIFICLLFSQNLVFAQNLNLFQETDRVQERDVDTKRAQRTSQEEKNPSFTLIGTGRFGDKYYASLLPREGKEIQVEWTKGKIIPIKEYNNYAIADIGSRSVSIRMPQDENCVDAKEKGVSCNGNILLLRLSNVTPLASKVLNEKVEDGLDNNSGIIQSGEVNQNDQVNENTKTIGNTDVLVRNPFNGELQTAVNLTPEELAAREERRQRRAEQFKNFEIVRIPDNEIPEGMQRIRTPFGDRLEPNED